MPGTINQYEIRQTLGTGFSCKVKLGVDTTSGRKVAIKIIKECADEQLMELVRTECEAMQQIEYHKNVIQQLEVNRAEYVKEAKNGQPPKSKIVDYIVLELATGGEIFDFVAVSGAFSED
jgi:serine/threonine protein kinase